MSNTICDLSQPTTKNHGKRNAVRILVNITILNQARQFASSIKRRIYDTVPHDSFQNLLGSTKKTQIRYVPQIRQATRRLDAATVMLLV
ncbi:MAG: hypothetical protein ABI351_04815 [Herbaspirillum sp.]